MKKAALVLAGLTAAVSATGILGSVASAQDEERAEVATKALIVEYRPEQELAVGLIVDELEPETVVTISASGFEANTTGSVEQCIAGSRRLCRNRLSVRSDDRGSAIFQYLITNNFAEGADEAKSCRLGTERCTIELRVGDKTSVIDTVFIDAAPPPGRLDVTPGRNLVIGDTVTVAASQFQPGAELTVLVCAAPSTSGTRCGAPGPVAPLTIGSDGTAEATMILDVNEVGSDRVACGRQVTCRIVVTSDQIGVRARPATLTFTSFPGADYDGARLITGLGVALILILFAAWLVRSTRWDPPREADSSPIDDAEFADLDLEAAQFDEQETATAASVSPQSLPGTASG